MATIVRLTLTRCLSRYGSVNGSIFVLLALLSTFPDDLKVLLELDRFFMICLWQNS